MLQRLPGGQVYRLHAMIDWLRVWGSFLEKTRGSHRVYSLDSGLGCIG